MLAQFNRDLINCTMHIPEKRMKSISIKKYFANTSHGLCALNMILFFAKVKQWSRFRIVNYKPFEDYCLNVERIEITLLKHSQKSKCKR